MLYACLMTVHMQAARHCDSFPMYDCARAGYAALRGDEADLGSYGGDDRYDY